MPSKFQDPRYKEYITMCTNLQKQQSVYSIPPNSNYGLEKHHINEWFVPMLELDPRDNKVVYVSLLQHLKIHAFIHRYANRRYAFNGVRAVYLRIVALLNTNKHTDTEKLYAFKTYLNCLLLEYPYYESTKLSYHITSHEQYYDLQKLNQSDALKDIDICYIRYLQNTYKDNLLFTYI